MSLLSVVLQNRSKKVQFGRKGVELGQGRREFLLEGAELYILSPSP